MWREVWISNVRDCGSDERAVLGVVCVDGGVGGPIVMGEDAIARSAASAVSNMATIGRLECVEVLLVSY